MFKMPFLRQRQDTFGLDVGSSAVKALQLSHNGGGAKLAALGIAPLPPEMIVEGTIREPAVVTEAIQEAVGRAGITTKNAAIAVSGRELIIKKIQIPSVPAKELHEAMQLEAEHHIPFAIDEVSLDYHVIDEAQGTMDLILVAVKKSKVTEYVSVVEAAGLNPVVVDVDGFALSNQFELNHPEARGETVALVDIGASAMKTNVVRDGASLFARDIPFGGRNYTQAIAQQLRISVDQAEAAKLGKDVGISWDSIVGSLEAVSRDLSLEIQRTFDYFASTSESERISKIVVAGGCAQLPGLVDYLSSTWGIQVEVARPFDRIHVGSAHADVVATAGPGLAVAVGLALRRAGDKDQ